VEAASRPDASGVHAGPRHHAAPQQASTSRPRRGPGCGPSTRSLGHALQRPRPDASETRPETESDDRLPTTRHRRGRSCPGAGQPAAPRTEPVHGSPVALCARPGVISCLTVASTEPMHHCTQPPGSRHRTGRPSRPSSPAERLRLRRDDNVRMLSCGSTSYTHALANPELCRTTKAHAAEHGHRPRRLEAAEPAPTVATRCRCDQVRGSPAYQQQRPARSVDLESSAASSSFSSVPPAQGSRPACG
jgi:hypothetical protein